ncbi:hypothetical protein AAG570_009978 [Ranatra chinensis]|uniref:DUF3752 domain-containing protein n=1 Tax=Ranatra chinensis TaxID=642074 RepID=A0ABD0YQN8_9HEMI
MFNNESDSEGEKILRHDRFRSERVLGGEGVNGGRVREHRSPARGDRSRHDRSRNDRRSREDRSYKRGRNEDYERRHSDEKRKRDSERRSPAISKKSQSLTSHNSTESRVRGSDRERHHHNHHSSERRRSRECSSGAKTVDRKEDRRSSEDTHRSSKMKESMRSGRGESQSKKSSEEVCVKDDEDRGDGRSSEKKSPMISGDTLKPKERSSVQREVKETKAKEDNRAEEMEARTEGSHTEGMPREEFFGPALPPKKERMIGPQLPEHMQNSSMEKDKKGGDKGDSYKESMEEENGGKPSREDTKRRGEMEKEEEGMRYGPALPPQSNQDMEEGELELDDDMIGPHLTPVDSPAQIALDRRATAIRKQMENKDYYGDGGEQGKTRREDWMTKLPDDRRGVVNALQPRKFRTREPAPKGDTSSWTDTPADKHKKQLAVQDIQSQKGGKLHLPFSVVSCVLFFWNMFQRLDAIFRLSDCGLSQFNSLVL